MKEALNIEGLLGSIYPNNDNERFVEETNQLIKKYDFSINSSGQHQLDQRDIALICYAHNIQKDNEVPLKTLTNFLHKYLSGKINTLHLLPFYPHSSDHGFSVIDYYSVDENVGTWLEIQELTKDFNLMFDLVLNHCSRENLWFVDFIDRKQPGVDYFIELPEDTDLSQVQRPRNNPLLSTVHTREGKKYVWCTFSEDQIDLNFRNPQVLLNMIDVLLFYISKGAKLIRLDAVGYAWKEVGTSCLNLEGAHTLVKILKAIAKHVDTNVKIITETNVPHEENIAYLANGDEADLIYQFSLPPLLLHALFTGNASHIAKWLQNLETPPEGCYYFNFLASHDGIGLRPLEGLVPQEEIESLIRGMRNHGAFTTMRTNKDGQDTPYEINISLFDALRVSREGNDTQFRTKRFICAHAFMLTLQGMPAFYIHSLIATPNDTQGVQSTGSTRQINRKIWNYDELTSLIENQITPNSIIFNEQLRLISIRKSQEYFSPSAEQEVFELSANVIAIRRTPKKENNFLVAIFNFSNQMTTVQIPKELTKGIGSWYDLVSSNDLVVEESLTLEPYQVLWLVKRKFKLFN